LKGFAHSIEKSVDTLLQLILDSAKTHAQLFSKQ
jgi:hypothetical protein